MYPLKSFKCKGGQNSYCHSENSMSPCALLNHFPVYLLFIFPIQRDYWDCFNRVSEAVYKKHVFLNQLAGNVAKSKSDCEKNRMKVMLLARISLCIHHLRSNQMWQKIKCTLFTDVFLLTQNKTLISSQSGKKRCFRLDQCFAKKKIFFYDQQCVTEVLHDFFTSFLN